MPADRAAGGKDHHGRGDGADAGGAVTPRRGSDPTTTEGVVVGTATRGREAEQPSKHWTLPQVMAAPSGTAAE